VSWYDAIKVAGDAIEALRNAELNGLLANVRMEGAKLAEENARLREELLALKEIARLRGTMVFRDNVYWHVEEGKTQGPCCPNCWPSVGKAVRMVDRGRHGWICPVCDRYIGRPGHGGQQEDDFDSPREPIS